eukprot:5863012-Pyramimonas_sp.AAC.1
MSLMLPANIHAQRDVVSVSSRFDHLQCVATPLTAAHLRTCGKAPVGIAMWSILLALIFSFFTQ